MGFLTSLIPAAVSLFGGGSKRKEQQVQTEPAGGQIPGFVLNAGSQIADFVSKFLPQFSPGEKYTGQLNAPITGAEQASQGFLGQFLDSSIGDIFGAGKQNIIQTLSGGFDPVTSDYYKGLRNEALRTRDEAIDAGNRAAAAGGSFYTDSRQRNTSDIAGRTSNFLTQTLGDLFNKERDRAQSALQLVPSLSTYETEFPLRKAQAASTIGSVPRLIEQAALERNYNDFVRRREEQALPLQAGLNLTGSGGSLRSGSTGMITQYAPSTFERVTGAVQGILGNNPGFFNDLLAKIPSLFG